MAPGPADEKSLSEEANAYPHHANRSAAGVSYSTVRIAKTKVRYDTGCQGRPRERMMLSKLSHRLCVSLSLLLALLLLPRGDNLVRSCGGGGGSHEEGGAGGAQHRHLINRHGSGNNSRNRHSGGASRHRRIVKDVGYSRIQKGDDDDEQRDLPMAEFATLSCGAELSDSEMERMGAAYGTWKEKHRNRNRNLQATNHNIPTHIHVAKHNATHGALDASQRTRMIDSLNRGFSNSSFTFSLDGYYEYENSTWAACNDTDTWQLQYQRDGHLPHVLNVYLCDIHARDIGGYAYYPTITQIPNIKHRDGISTYWCLFSFAATFVPPSLTLC